ncbi:LOW QUALITY PROTEIN: hypothetical protein BRARA_D00779 [Brassica rapa]|uniref:ATP-dependent DNA helicase n=1 Tax=Brassica campestris TaxID=3711 RepID=A0A397ZJN4_BRACM|nr:LOW QUALITY PROTEIN: hypothetical protein BRARA_D00779 [Brassica rapa]
MKKTILLSKRTSSLPQDKCSTSKSEDNPIVECTKCGALMWTSESTGKDSRVGELTFTICCNHDQIMLPPINQPPPMLEELLQHRWFRDTIRVYNSVLAFTSIGMKMDYTVVNAPGPYTIRIQGQTHHRIGSLIPRQGRPPEYLQLYIFDTGNEVRNHLNAMGQTSTEGNLDETTLARLIEMLDEHNCLAKLFRRARDYYEGSGQEFNIRLLSDKRKGKEYDLPSTSEVAGLIVGDMSSTIGVRDVVVQFQSDTLQQIRDDHPLYMSLQYLLLFPHGGRLLHQYVVDVFTAIEEDQLRWARNNQDVLRAELYSNVLDAIHTAAKFTDGPRYLVEKYHDVMSICREYGNPDLFITMTANPNWKEIKEHHEVRSATEGFQKGTFFKSYTAALHRIEFQKRGLPHEHILLWFGNSSRTPSSEEVNEIISAELPNKEEDPEAYNLVTKHMIHGPCGVINPKSPCMENNVCTKKYPRPYNNSTSIDKSGYVLYRRRRNENESVVKNGAPLNNTFVVPHNVKLLKKYEAHINVEWYNRTSAVKYLFKYITKGVDRASAVIEKENTTTTFDTVDSGEPKEKVIKQRNEIQEYIEARYLSACESMWRTFAFHIHKRKSSVEKLIIHLEGEHNITIKETDNLGRVIRKQVLRRQCLLNEWYYAEEYFVWNNNSKVWSERKKGKTIGRIVAVHPSAGDRYYLRILINKIKGPRSYDELKTFNDVKYHDFKSVCHARDYLDDDVEWLESMSEGARTATPYQLRDMQRILGHTNLELDDETLEQYTLIEVEKLMCMQDRSLNDIKEMPKKRLDMTVRGTRKTFLYQTIISRLRSRKQIVLPVASSVIATLLLPNGRTAHSRFNISLKLDEDKLCNIKPGTMLAELIEKTDLIIWNEAPMTHKHAFEALDKTLKDILSIKNPHAKHQTFGGKTVLLDGDFRQILPTNMRVNQDEKEFFDWLLKVGEGRPESEEDNEDDGYHDQMINIDPSLTKDESLKQVVDAAYGDINQIEASQSFYTDKAILTPQNDTVDEINVYTISKTDGESKDYYSYDSFEVSETQSNQNDTLYAIEYLNSMEFPGLPSHKLTLQVGAPIMLMRNINQTKRLCNGTRMILIHIGKRVLKEDIITGSHIGNEVFVTPRFT